MGTSFKRFHEKGGQDLFGERLRIKQEKKAGLEKNSVKKRGIRDGMGGIFNGTSEKEKISMTPRREARWRKKT